MLLSSPLILIIPHINVTSKRKEVKYAAFFHCEVEDLGRGTEEVTEEMKQRLKWCFDLREKGGLKHRMIQATVGKKPYPCLRCSHLQRIVDVDEVRTLFWCRKCAGWTTSNKMGRRLKNPCKARNPRVAYQLKKLEQGIRLSRISVSIRMEMEMIAMHNGEDDGHDEKSEAKMLYEEGRLSRCIGEGETGGRGNVHSNIRLFEEGQLAPQNEVKCEE